MNTKGESVMREVFSHPSFRKLFFANLFSGFGQGMSMIGISWHLAASSSTAAYLGTTMFVSSVLMFLIAPYIGTLIDRFPRKRILLWMNGSAFSVLAVFGAIGVDGSFEKAIMISIFFMTTLVWQIHYPTQSALVQESFSPRHYQSINSLLEIEGQTASVLSGAAAGFMLDWFGFQTVLLFNAFTYLLAVVLMYSMEYTFTVEKEARSNAGTTWLQQFAQSFRMAREKKGLLLFGTCALMPFIAVMAGNLLSPVYVSKTLMADVTIFSLHEMTYAIGAVSAGFLLYRISQKWGDGVTLIGNILLFALTLAVIVALPNTAVFVLLTSLVGWCNASSRLVRQNMLMMIVPNEHMGRIMSLFQSIGLLMRLSLLGFFTLMLEYADAGTGYLILAGLLVVSAAGVYHALKILTQVQAKNEAVL